MRYDNIVTGTFLERVNRFTAIVMTNGSKVLCHVKNTGRCRELLLPETEVYLQFHPQAKDTGRKTEYSLIGVKKLTESGALLINMDSQAPNQAAFEWLSQKPDITELKREVFYHSSRFDLSFHRNGRPSFMEVKGVTLEENGTARFPDAPTERGIKHLTELGDAVRDGWDAYALFVIQMKGVHEFQPNWKTHPAFGEALCQAQNQGVKLLAMDCIISQDSIQIDRPIPIILNISS